MPPGPARPKRGKLGRTGSVAGAAGRSKQARIRRTPEAARALILGAASHVLAELGPDRAGLKEVAVAAGVSHALVTHYFGTFSALVEEVLELQMTALRDAIVHQIAEADVDWGVQELIQLLFVEFRKPVYGRLVAWALLSGRIDASSFFSSRNKGLRTIADAVVGRSSGKDQRIGRDEVERLIVMVWCTVASYAVAAPTLWQALGRRPSQRRDRQFAAMLAEIVQLRLDTA